MAGPTTHGVQKTANGVGIYADGELITEFISGGSSEMAQSINFSDTAAFSEEVEFFGNVHLVSTLEAGADGVGAVGEQLTSGGAGAACDWTAAASMRQFKKLLGIRDDYDEALRLVVETPVYDFQYKDKSEAAERITTTGDTETVYTGIMADEAPFLMHHKGRILNPINTTGYLMLAIKALSAQVEDLRGQLTKAAQA